MLSAPVSKCHVEGRCWLEAEGLPSSRKPSRCPKAAELLVPLGCKALLVPFLPIPISLGYGCLTPSPTLKPQRVDAVSV